MAGSTDMSSFSDSESTHSTLQDALYTVGRRQTHPLVHAGHLEGHLALLHAFDTLRLDVESGDLSHFPPEVCAMDPGARWGWFVSVAVERFERWCKCIRDAQSNGLSIEKTLPPIDVVMVWHTYLLNPIWYAEDTMRVPTLWSLSNYTNYLADHLECPEELLTDSPDPGRVQFWMEQTMTPYDPFDLGELMDARIKCPHCEIMTNAPFLAPDGKGYAQSKFETTCSTCGQTITKELLGLYKFAKDLVKDEYEGPTAFLAGTLHSQDEMADTSRASLIKERVKSSMKAYSPSTSTFRHVVPASEIMTELNHDPAFFSQKLRRVLVPKMANRILHAYSDDKPFSIELVGAVLRQGSFIQKMAELGWTDPSFVLDNDGEHTLKHCVARYHAFLNLIAGSPGNFLVPTLDIDLAWHSHQLLASRYQADCKRLMGRYVDHDDKVEEGHLATSFDLTCRAWTDAYNVPYTHCGCPRPGTTFRQRVRRVLRRGKNNSMDMDLDPPNTSMSGTHPSDHNAVFRVHRAGASLDARERRQRKIERRRRREARECEREREHEGSEDTSEDHDGSGKHSDAFMYPVPLEYAPTGGCVVAVGGVIDGGSAFGAQCAAGGAGCTIGSAGCGGSTCGAAGGSCAGGYGVGWGGAWWGAGCGPGGWTGS